ncbi:MAG TPA: 2OG-Fe dioxygenase family protein [Streptosporangiaceae bacterium]|nr:2OG-Fe dioxygenase family protein [Streptosporangiaceae bacterium]
MTNDTALRRRAELDRIWNSLASCGYALTDDQSIGLPRGVREHFRLTYFNEQLLRHDDGDWPADRKRARDVISYDWGDGDPALAEFDTITITDRGGVTGHREHARVMMLSDPHAAALVRAFLGLVPPDRRQDQGTFGVNLFRTYTNVVTRPHCDDEEYIIIYVINRIGNGAETYLYRHGDIGHGRRPTAEPVFLRQLDPGQIIIFEDRMFKHGATPLVPPPTGSAMRDALVCTVDYHSSYLEN